MQNDLQQKASKLRMYSIQANWSEIAANKDLLNAVQTIVSWEENERSRRKLGLYLRKANTNEFEPISNFDWSRYKDVDQGQIVDLFGMEFLCKGENIILIGPSGVGKTTIAKNLIFSAAQQGNSALFVESGEMLDNLVSQKGHIGLEKAMTKYIKPQLLAIDEIGYLSYNAQHADLLFQLIHKRCSHKKSIIVTTNRPFEEWGSVFPNAASVTALVDRLVERCEIVMLEASSYRAKRFFDNQQAKRKARASKKKI